MKKVEVKSIFKKRKKNKSFYDDQAENRLNNMGSMKIYYLCFLLYLIVNAIFSPLFLAILISLICVIIYYYFKYKKLAKHISFKRNIIDKYVAHEDHIKIVYEIKNSSNFICPNGEIEEEFDGTLKRFVHFQTGKEISPGGKEYAEVIIKCNGNTGIAIFKTMKFKIRDPLNIFQFTVNNPTPNEIFIFPKIKKIRDFMITPNKYSMNFGLYNISKAGDAVNFIGVRKYQDGDPFKKINWKLSQKVNEIIVNEFERNVNGDIGIFMDLHSHLHSGQGKNSTWEYAKDITLAIAVSNIKQFNNVRVITNFDIFDSLGNVSDLSFFQLAIANTDISFDPNYNDILKRISLYINHGSNYFHITPILNINMMGEVVERLFEIRKKVSSFKLILINPEIFLKEIVSEYSESLSMHIENTMKEFENKIIPELTKMDIDIFLVDIDEQNEITYEFQDLRRESYKRD